MAKIFYFLTFAGSAACSPYNSVFLSSRGFTSSQVGLILSSFPLVRIFVVPYVSYLCDRKDWGMTILFICYGLGGLATVLNGAVSVESTPTDQKNSTPVLAMVAICFCFQALFKGPTAPIMDQLTMELLPPERKKEWGRLRSFGAYGWGLGAPAFAQLIELTSYFVSFFFYPIFGLIGCFALNATTRLTTRPQTKRDFAEVLRFLLKYEHLRTLWLLIFSVLMGCGLSIVSTYLFIFLREELDAPQLLLGLTITGMVVVEIPIFRCSGWLHKHFSDSSLLLIAMGSWALRVFGYSYLPNAWLVLLYEPLHGLTFGCSWLSAVHALSSTFPQELNASAFGLLHSSVNGVGTILGTVVGGYGYEYFGARPFFRICAVCMAVMTAIFFVVDRKLKQTHPDAEVVPAVAVEGAKQIEMEEGRVAEDACCPHKIAESLQRQQDEEPRFGSPLGAAARGFPAVAEEEEPLDQAIVLEMVSAGGSERTVVAVL